MTYIKDLVEKEASRFDYCIECGTEIRKGNVRCPSCAEDLSKKESSRGSQHELD